MRYQYLVNMAQDEKGRSTGYMDGYQPGDPLCVAYSGDIQVQGQSPKAVCERLFEMFNINRPADYRGPSMSKGAVVKLLNVAFACGSVGFVPVDISGSAIVPTDPRWNV